MVLTHTPKGELGSIAPDFDLPGVDGKNYSLAEFKGAPALVVVFMCNHCPYVIAVQDRINRLARDYASRGVRVVGINSNHVAKYPDDSFDAMKVRAREKNYVFPYLWDETQEIARAYGAVCTPDFFVYDGRRALVYRGRLDDSWKDETKVSKRELAQALDQILAGESPALEQVPSMGCSIKWK